MPPASRPIRADRHLPIGNLVLPDRQRVAGPCISAQPKTLALIPLGLRPVVEGALGYDADHQFTRCADLQTVLKEAAAPGFGVPGRNASVGIPQTPEVNTPAERDRSSAPLGQLPETLGQYRISERIGGGGMGDVYKAYDVALDRIVAVKVLPADLARHHDFVRRFRIEATAIARLSHPNVVQIFSFGEDAGRHFFAMQFVAGESLADLLRRWARLPVDETLEIVEQCLAGLAAPHRRNLIHRDIKPGNILLDRENHRALLADFGLVKSIESSDKLTTTGVIMGTVDYISPEQARGVEVDCRADLYSIGALMYRMLSGRLPFIADSPTGMIFQHAYEQPIPLVDLVPEIPPQLAAIVMRLLAKAPDRRYPSAAALLEEIQAFRAGKPPLAWAPPAESKSRIITAPNFASIDAAPDLPQSAGHNRMPRWRAKLWELFHAHAPQAVKSLVDTEHQLDGAVIEYERRRQRLAELVQEATAVADEFAAQIAIHRSAADAAARRAQSASDPGVAESAERDRLECQHVADGFAEQLTEQHEQLDGIRLKLKNVDARLVQLRNQRDVLQARQHVAVAQLAVEGHRPTSGRGKVGLIAFGAGAILLFLAIVIVAKWSRSLTPSIPIASTSTPRPSAADDASPAAADRRLQDPSGWCPCCPSFAPLKTRRMQAGLCAKASLSSVLTSLAPLFRCPWPSMAVTNSPPTSRSRDRRNRRLYNFPLAI